jgi:hypothetical protein
MSEEVSAYLEQPLRVLYDACRQAGQDDGGRRCPTCAVRDICEAELARRSAANQANLQRRWHSPKALPAADTAWGARKKAVILAIRWGIIGREAACARYLLSPEELVAWEVAFDRGGHRALSGKAAARRRWEKNRSA